MSTYHGQAQERTLEGSNQTREVGRSPALQWELPAGLVFSPGAGPVPRHGPHPPGSEEWPGSGCCRLGGAAAPGS